MCHLAEIFRETMACKLLRIQFSCFLIVSHSYGTLETEMWLDGSPGWAVHSKPASRGDRFIPRTHIGHKSHANSCLSLHFILQIDNTTVTKELMNQSPCFLYPASLYPIKEGASCRNSCFPGLCDHDQLMSYKEKSAQYWLLLAATGLALGIHKTNADGNRKKNCLKWQHKQLWFSALARLGREGLSPHPACL